MFGNRVARHFAHRRRGTMNTVSKFGTPLAAGLVGILICHFLILVGFVSGLRYPIYVFSYPIVYPALAALITHRSPGSWVSTSLLVNAVPLLYWYLLLWSDGKFLLRSALDWESSSVLFIIVPVNVALSLLAAFIVVQRSDARRSS